MLHAALVLALLFPRADVDQLCHQRDCAWSGLYWHTDLESAKAEARATHRPILSLRLLGRLDQELSCANSRYFRTILYSDRAISRYLREHYVLHWQSIRPVPVMTVDLGDGRRIVRTITGNSIHYVLDEEGRPLDAIPGLYSPRAFLLAIREGRALYDSHPDRDALRAYHASRTTTDDAPLPSDPARLAVTKAIVEVRPLESALLGARGEGEVVFDENTIALIRAKHGAAHLHALLTKLRRSVAADTEMNETRLRPRIRRWFADGEVTTIDALNDRVYREIFLMPPEDHWMGLVADDAFSAIDGEGLLLNSAVNERRSR
jgi:hypothetical protein